jgi:hypothetical protein
VANQVNNQSAKILGKLTATLAYQNWERRGCPHGSPEIDWLAAEEILARPEGHSKHGFSLYSLQMGPDEGSTPQSSTN